MREVMIHQAFSHWLDSEGIPFLHSRTDRKTSSTLGDPDYFCLLAGRVLAVEIKVGINKLSPAQEKRIACLRKAGNSVEVCYSLEDAIRAVQEWAGVLTLPADKNDSTATEGCLKEASKADHVFTQNGLQADPVTNCPYCGLFHDPEKTRCTDPRTGQTLRVPDSLSEQEKANSVGARCGSSAAGVSAERLVDWKGQMWVTDGTYLLRQATQADRFNLLTGLSI